MDNSASSTVTPFGWSDSSSTQCLVELIYTLFVNGKYLTVSSVLPSGDWTDFFPLHLCDKQLLTFETHLTIVYLHINSCFSDFSFETVITPAYFAHMSKITFSECIHFTSV